MKKIYIITILIIHNLGLNYYSFATGTFEIWIENRVHGTDLLMKFFPDGGLYNGKTSIYSQDSSKYSLHRTTMAGFPIFRRGSSGSNTTDNLKYIVGLDGISLSGISGAPIDYFKLWRPNYTPGYPYGAFDNTCKLASDASYTGSGDNDGIFGYGKYIFEIYTTSEVLIAQIPIDFLDLNYPASYLRAEADLFIYIDTITTSPPKIKYWWASGLVVEKNLYEDSTANGHIEVFRRFYGYKTPLIVTPNRDFAVTDQSFLNYPNDATKLNDGYATIEHSNPGDFGINLLITHNVTSRDTALGNGNITIAKNGYLKIADGKIFNMTTPLAGYHNLVVQDSSFSVVYFI